MGLNSILAQQKAAIIKKWFTLVIETYPSETGKFLKSQKDPMANPVGRTVSRGLEALFDELLGCYGFIIHITKEFVEQRLQTL